MAQQNRPADPPPSIERQTQQCLHDVRRIQRLLIELLREKRLPEADRLAYQRAFTYSREQERILQECADKLARHSQQSSRPSNFGPRH